MYIDGHVDFENVPFCGINNDNIFTQQTIRDIKKGTRPVNGVMLPRTRVDNLLVMDYGIYHRPAKGMGCFLADTQVWVNGRTVRISKVTVSAQIKKLEEHIGSWQCRDIVLVSGNTISVVESHLFLTPSGLWIHAQDLRSGMSLKTRNGSIKIKNITVREKPYVGKVYNIKTITNTYMVGKDAIIVRDY